MVTVVVPTHNRAFQLPGLLAALESQRYPSYEVVVVDDASDDATSEVLERWKGERRRVLRAEASSGSYAARNLGWREASGEIVAFTDDDCLPQPGWLEGLVGMMRGSDVLGAQGLTLARPGAITPFTHQIEQTKPGPPYRTCNIAYRRDVLVRMDGFDEDLRWYADNIFGLRARKLGPIAFAPDAIVYHPPRPREWRDRAMWRRRFAADEAHRQVLRQLAGEPRVPRRLLPVILWVARPIVKQSGAHLLYFLRHPASYVLQARPMLWEKRELLAALLNRGPAPSLHGGIPTWVPSRLSKSLPALADDPLVSVIVVTRDRPTLLEGALAALDSQTWRHREVVVVEHGEYRGAEPIAIEHGARYVTPSHSTLGAARQAGVSAARGDLIAFTDDDCLPRPEWLASLVSAFRKEPLWGVQGRTLGEVGPIGSHTVRVEHGSPLFQTCNIAYRREAVERSGGVDPGFVGWFEDTALGASVLSHGPIGFEADAVVTHRATDPRPRDRQTWGALLRDEQRLAQTHPQFYRRTRGRGLISAVITRWLLGSVVKQLLRELPSAPRQPVAYLRFLTLLAKERAALIEALRDVLRESR
jgi:glycosyltransferase involved in cell wall biosynthesis